MKNRNFSTVQSSKQTDTKIRILDEYGIEKNKPDYSNKTTYLKRDGKKQTYYTEFYDDIKKKPCRPKQMTSSKNNFGIIFSHYLIEKYIYKAG